MTSCNLTTTTIISATAMSITVAHLLHNSIAHAVDDMFVDFEFQPRSDVDHDTSGAKDSSSTCLSSRPTKIPRLEEQSFAAASTSDVKGKSKEGTPNLNTERISSTSVSILHLHPQLPPEILDTILDFLENQDMRPVLSTNSFLGSIAQRRVYASVSLDSPVRTVAFLQTVVKNPRLAALVRSLELDVSKQGVVKNGKNRSGSKGGWNLRAAVGEAAAAVSGVGAALVGGGPLPNPNGNVNTLPPVTNGLALAATAGPANPPGQAATSSQLRRDLFGVAHLTANFYRLLQRALHLMPALTELSLELPKSHSPVWLLEGCPFRLKKFATSMHCHRPLARFLSGEIVEGVEELTLRGFHNESVFLLPFVGSAPPSNALVTNEDEEENEKTFRLPRHALPRLRMFSAIHAGPPIVRTIMRGRPVEIVSVPLFPQGGVATLDALAMGSAMLKRLNVISFDPGAPNFLFEHLTQRFGALEALHVVMLMADYSKEFLEDCATLLGRFVNLKYITFMAASADETLNTLDEDDVAKRWHKACPTLQTIILPRGRVWFQGEPEPAMRTGQEIVRLGSPLR
ncbi:unnamed protein product [Cyclocybe aegerita]|uniref:Uncharacterized protein n=1 Tax=Cyclocybe aegerita TaxID=1973307 RepID=A0A8S0XPK5_CYCAE|nr:unnamed protein product [Cyclocybe aegerita]